MKILIAGDSFAADQQTKFPKNVGWPNMLAQEYTVTNLARAGCGEYKIWQQLKSVQLNKFDHIIIAHTSPNRIYVKSHPVHAGDPLHANCDAIYSDIKEHSKTNKRLDPLVDFFENYFDEDHAKDIHNLICGDIDKLTKPFPVTHIISFDWKGLYKFDNMLNFYPTFKSNRGKVNHYTDKGNIEVYNKIKKQL